MDFLQMEYFCRVAEQGNITRAAEQLHISQPSLSQTISKLEGELQSQLLIRGHRGTQLTGQGRRFLEYARATIRARQEIIQEIQDYDGIPRGEIVVLSNALSYVIAKLFCDYKQRYPHVTIRFVTQCEDKHDRGWLEAVDLFVSMSLETPQQSDSCVVYTEPLMAALPVMHPLAENDTLLLEDLADEEFILFQDGELRNLTDHSCQQAGFQPKVILNCTNTNMLFGMISIGMGVSIFPRSWKRLHNENDIVLLPITAPNCMRTVRLLWQKEKYMSKAVLSFREYIIENIKQPIESNFF